MAARYAVASGNWTGAIWAATSGGAAGSAAVPTSADDVTINKNVVATLDATTCVANSVAATVGSTGADTGGKLTPSQTANSKLVVQQGLYFPGSSTLAYSTWLNLDMSAVPAYKCEVYANNVRASGAGYGITLEGEFVLKGAPRKAFTYTQAALTANTTKSVVVDDATGWLVGDILVFATTQAYNATPRVDKVTIDTITPGSGTSATVTWVDGAGTGGAVLYGHLTRCLVGNFTRNVRIGPATAGDAFSVNVSVSSSKNAYGLMRDLMVVSPYASSSYPGGVFRALGTNVSGWRELSNSAFYDWDGTLLICNNSYIGTLTRTNNVGFTTRSANAPTWFNSLTNTSYMGDDVSPAIFQCASVVAAAAPYSRLYDPKISGVTGVVAYLGGIGTSMITGSGDDSGIWSCNTVFYGSAQANMAKAFVDSCRLGCGPKSTAAYAGACNNLILQQFGGDSLRLTGCVEDVSTSTYFDSMTYSTPYTLAELFSRNGDPAIQQVFGNMSDTVPQMERRTDSAAINRSTSSLRMKWTGTSGKLITQQFNILTKSGSPITLIGFFKKSGVNDPIAGDAAYGASTLPYVEIGGLGITPVRITMSGGTAAGAWEKFSFLPGTATEVVQNTGSDGELTVTFAGQSAVDGASCYFAGVPLAPFVTRARHYGYLFDETSPTRTVNGTVSASEATAIAYTGMTVTWNTGATPSTTSITLDNTFQKLYDYTQAAGCLNVGSNMPITGAGVAGNPSLFAAGDITISAGKVLNGSGSISAGAYTLTTEFATSQAYSYTGGTWSQDAADPAFSGGTLTIDTHVTSTTAFSMTGGNIVFGEASALWDFGSCTFSGTINLSTVSGETVTVAINTPSGFTINNTEPGNITVVTPTVHNYVTATFSGADTRVVLYNVTKATEIDNSLVASPATGYSFEITTEADPGDVIDMHYFTEGYAEGRTRFTWGAASVSVAVEQALDPVIQAFRTEDSITDYTTITEFNIYAPTIYIQADDTDGTSKISRLATFYNGVLTTEDGARYFRGGMTMLSTGAVRVNKSVVDLLLENASATLSLRFSDEVTRRLYTDDGSSIIAPSSVAGSIEYAYGGVPDTVSVSTGLSGADATNLANAATYSATAATQATLSRKFLSNKRILDRTTGVETIYDDAGVAMYQRQVSVDEAGATPYDGTQAPHRVDKYT